MTNLWIAAGAGEHRARARLFCFAHAGGGALLFRGWQRQLAPDIEICPVVLPGRERRIREAAFDRIEDLLGPLCRELAPYVDMPVAFFGHSMGAVIAYEAACELSARAGCDPLALFVSGRRAPHLPSRRPPNMPLDDETLFALMRRLNGTPAEVLNDPDLMALYLPCLRADFALNDAYRRARAPRLGCPVLGLVGNGDPEVSAAEMAEWGRVTSGFFTYRVFDGDHFYLKGARPDVIGSIRQAMEGALAGADRVAPIQPDRPKRQSEAR